MVCCFFRFRDQESLQSQKRRTISRRFPLLVPWLSILGAKLDDILDTILILIVQFAGTSTLGGSANTLGESDFLLYLAQGFVRAILSLFCIVFDDSIQIIFVLAQVCKPLL